MTTLGSASLRTQFSWLFVSRLAGSGLQAITIIVLARVTGPASFGVVGALMSVALVALTVADLGVGSYVAKVRVSGETPEVRACLRANAISTAVAIVLGLLATAAAAPMVVAVALTPLVVALALEKNIDTVMSIPIADGDSVRPAVSIVLRRTAAAALFVPVVLTTDVDPVLWFGLSLLIGMVLAQWYTGRTVRRTLRAVESAAMWPAVRSSSPYLLNNLVIQARLLDTFIVAQLLGGLSAGLYAIGQRITNPILIAPSTIAALLLPHSARAQRGQALRLVRMMMVLAVAGTTLAAIPASLSSGILGVLVGPQYQAGAWCLTWMLLGLPALAFSGPLGAILQGQGEAVLVAKNGMLFGVLTLSAVTVGALIDGINGAAAAAAASFVLKCASLWLRSERMWRNDRGGSDADSSCVDDVERSTDRDRSAGGIVT